MGERVRELIILIIGDIFFFILALWLTLAVRYLSLPNLDIFYTHLVPFFMISGVWLVIFYISGLYDKQTNFYKSLMFSRILNTQVVNGAVAALLFFIIPFGITPKTNLVIYVFISVLVFVWWRMYLYPRIAPTTKYRAIMLADGPEVIELVDEVNNNDRYNYAFVRIIDEKAAGESKGFEQKLLQLIERERVSIIVANSNGPYMTPVLPHLFDLAFLRHELTFLDFYKVYEDTFDRVPLSALSYEWFINNVPQSQTLIYDFAKRIIDVVGAIILGLALLIMLPFIYLAMRLEGKGDLFIKQERVGQFNKPVEVYKIRTMTENRSLDAGWIKEDARQGNTITKVGAVLRKLSIDELPQVWNILKGDMSLIGPRNDIVGLGERSAGEIPYYNIRNFVKPGVTGWAQTHQHYMGNNISPQSLDETKTRLSYDLYYVKNRSLLLDMDIAFRTVKTLLARFGIGIKFRR